ncbi:hypothetical protein DXG01_005682 [Tephrocybe rancida]|nr:hypothetical protein DXG01_005682 [Tephrocybe rancida]
MPPQLFDLPPEIILQILCFLDLSELALLQCTSSILCDLIQDSQGLQYRFAAAAAGVEDNAYTSHAAHERIKLLKNREEGWLNVDIDFEKTIPIISFPSGIYDLTGGIYFRGDWSRRTIHYCRLPSQPSDAAVWKQITVDKPLVDIGVSVFEHDLIAILTYTPSPKDPRRHVIEVALFELSTGKPHPLAKSPVLFVSESSLSQPSILLEIVGEHLVLVLAQHTLEADAKDSLRVFEWKTGALKMNVERDYRGYHDVVFLSPTILLLPNYHHNTFDIWEIPVGGAPVPTEPYLALALPGLRHGSGLANISCRCEPNPAPSGTPHSPAPFHTSPDDAIIVFNIHLHTTHMTTAYSLFVHRSALLKACTTSLPGDAEGVIHYIPRELAQQRVPGEHVRAWDNWGPQFTRAIDGTDIPLRWITTTAGQRAIITYEEVDEDGGEIWQYSTLLDFNPLHVEAAAREKESLPGDYEDHEVIREASTFPVFGLFEPITTRLPYLSLEVPVDPAWSDRAMGLLLDEERLLALLSSNHELSQELKVMHIGKTA